jgi:hypothetical protein
MNEAKLRDLLATQIGVLGTGLTLLNKEQFIPNDIGTRSFIDLYARDLEGHHVLIELKRTDAASREALHEVHKYAEAVKRHFGARENEIVLLVVSTEWRELLVPFSRLVVDTTLTIRGVQLLVDPSTGSLTAERVAVLPVSYGRFIAPWHEVHWYLDASSLAAGLKSIAHSFSVKGIEDYVVAVLQPPEPCVSEHQAAMVATLRQMMERDDAEELHKSYELPKYEFAAYVAMQMLSDSEYLQILESRPSSLTEVTEYLNPDQGEERLLQLHEAVSAAEPLPTSDHLEIGYPAKLTKLLDTRGLEVVELQRHGMFSRNALLSDESIFSELRGEDGATGQRFRRTISIANRAHVASARREIASCLEQNPVWASHILRALEEIERQHSDAEIDISIFNPATGILTIYLTASREDGVLFAPTYSLIVRSPEPCQMYFGSLEYVKPASTLRAMLRKYYQNDLGSLLLTMTWGGKESRDIDIIEDMGAAYRSFRCDINGSSREVYALRDDRWRPCPARTSLELWQDYLNRNEPLVREVLVRVGARDKDGYFEAHNSRLIVEELIDVAGAESASIYRSDPPTTCDACGCFMSDETTALEVENQADKTAFAMLCADCFVGFGATKAKAVYQNREGRWLKVDAKK